MKGLLSLVLVSIALLQMTAAAPTAPERSQALKKREGEQNVEKRKIWMYGQYMGDDDDDLVLEKLEEALGRLSEVQILHIIKAVMVQ
ncbi:hypothetical protein F4604DRAFT_1927491 [Suillus subluteus]|nr:hypothetical protein F4604DRAFT_1927491 [Suillus subluteus]